MPHHRHQHRHRTRHRQGPRRPAYTLQSPIKARSSNNVSDVIVLNNATGDLRIMKNLIHYADGIFRLTIRANNSQDPERFSDILVEQILQAFDVHNITSCGVSRATHTPAQHALLALAGALPLAALIAALVLCCMHSN
ncbi:hypothetical protein MSG28_007246, partial [Choristoneura fumiferana]